MKRLRTEFISHEALEAMSVLASHLDSKLDGEKYFPPGMAIPALRNWGGHVGLWLGRGGGG